MTVKTNNANEPVWSEVTVKNHIPAQLKKLDELAHNLWWSWNPECVNLFRSLDNDLYKAVGKNPIELLSRLGFDRLSEISKDEKLIAEMDRVYKNFRTYVEAKPDQTRPSVAYFCMEYGLTHVLKIYSGGLGVLAGDYLKEASDSNVDLCAVGFLYRYGYFTQSISMDGGQFANYEAQDFDRLPIERLLDKDGNQIIIDVPFPDKATIHAAVWRVNVGRISLYLLDTDILQNAEYDRSITHALYGGDWENRLRQEYLLGIGGVLLLKKLGIKKDIYHCNEGHAALCNVQRLVDYTESGLNFDQALELVRASSLYTVHTPVPAGHDYFDESLFGKYLGWVPERLGISWDEFIGLGRMNVEDHGEKFCMSTFLCKTCQEVNGVSKLHGEVSREMFNGIWRGYFPEESHVGYVTNGVHLPTWIAHEWRDVFKKYFDPNFMKDQSNPAYWERIYEIPDAEIWNTRIKLKGRLISYIRERFRESWLKNQGDPSRVVSLLDKISPNALLIGFSRRFATYKRAHLLFSDLDRLSKIVNNPDYPVQFIFAGKAHPADGAGQGLIKRIYEISQQPEFLGKILFLENYDMELAHRLVSGVDIWLNTPTRKMEASGTSGEKAQMNGVLNFSVLDGWWYEGYREGAGWALSATRTYHNQEQQDRLDALTIYSMLEQEIIPLYYARNRSGYSENWVRVVKESFAKITPHYTMKRQLDDYYEKFYKPEAKRFKQLSEKDNAAAKELAAWKETVAARWNDIRIVSTDDPANVLNGQLISGDPFTIRHVVDEQGLDNAIGIDMVIISNRDGSEHFRAAIPMNVVSREGNNYTFELTDSIDFTGSFKIGFRMYPKHPALAHRQDFCYVRWF
ncbi:alpha-glucan family phosphorylase [Alloprevotella tannerae]|uniref:Alpha-glucan family phosphorylase n=1 Tax=Alloprevotella tannerae TaxID=76122 RepID=A0A929WZB0_9BACT|nr:alpha-glucan family phosphorylase [Alloprevotella tannerae]MBF0969628.1 alpha-glucan family phosphorylase [Alloprevotella tannerae]